MCFWNFVSNITEGIPHENARLGRPVPYSPAGVPTSARASGLRQLFARSAARFGFPHPCDLHRSYKIVLPKMTTTNYYYYYYYYHYYC